MLISERIYKYMEEKKISQIEFAKRTGISQSTISDWRRKGTNPSADQIMIICEVLGISPNELLLDAGSRNSRTYKETDYIMVDKRSGEYRLIEYYQRMDAEMKKRLEAYAEVLCK